MEIVISNCWVMTPTCFFTIQWGSMGRIFSAKWIFAKKQGYRIPISLVLNSTFIYYLCTLLKNDIGYRYAIVPVFKFECRCKRIKMNHNPPVEPYPALYWLTRSKRDTQSAACTSWAMTARDYSRTTTPTTPVMMHLNCPNVPNKPPPIDIDGRCCWLKGILWDFFIFTLEQIIVLNKSCT